MSVSSTEPITGSYLMPALEHATVSDAMHPGIISCDADTSLTDVARLMATHHVHSVAVTGVDLGGSSAWGIVSDLDLVACGARHAERTAGALARRPTITVEPALPLAAACELMLEHEVTHVLVVDKATDRPIGVLSTLDVAGILAWGEA